VVLIRAYCARRPATAASQGSFRTQHFHAFPARASMLRQRQQVRLDSHTPTAHGYCALSARAHGRHPIHVRRRAASQRVPARAQPHTLVAAAVVAHGSGTPTGNGLLGFVGLTVRRRLQSVGDRLGTYYGCDRRVSCIGGEHRLHVAHVVREPCYCSSSVSRTAVSSSAVGTRRPVAESRKAGWMHRIVAAPLAPPEPHISIGYRRVSHWSGFTA